MNFNTFSTLYGTSNASSSFSGSGYTSSLVQTAQNFDFSLTIITGSNLGDPLQITSSFGGFGSGSLNTSSFNERTSSVALTDATPFQSILVQGTVQGVNATSAVTFTSPISGSNISASGDISADKFIIDKGAATGSQMAILGDGVLALTNAAGGQLNKISLKTLEIDDSSSNNTSFRLGGRIKVGQGNIGVDPNHQHEVSGSLNVTGSIVMVGDVNFTNLPTSDPGVVGRLYRDGATVKVSI